MNYLLTHQETERLKFRLLEPEDFDTWIMLVFGIGQLNFRFLSMYFYGRYKKAIS